MPDNDHLCNYCQSFFDSTLILGNLVLRTIEDGKIERWSENHSEADQKIQWDHRWPTFCEFVKSAALGCHLCALFLLQVSGRKRSMFQSYESRHPTRAFEDGHPRC